MPVAAWLWTWFVSSDPGPSQLALQFLAPVKWRMWIVFTWFVLPDIGDRVNRKCTQPQANTNRIWRIYDLKLVLSWPNLVYVSSDLNPFLPKPPVPGVRHGGISRHPGGLGRTSRKWDVSEGGVWLPAPRGDSQHPQRRHHSVPDWLLHHQVWLRHRLLKWVFQENTCPFLEWQERIAFIYSIYLQLCNSWSHMNWEANWSHMSAACPSAVV